MDGEQALRIFQQHRAQIVLIVLDMSMPRLDGPETFRELRDRGYAAPILFSSGYAVRQEVSDHLSQEAGVDFLHKPYAPPTLIAKVRALLAF